jgi:hypothetical protein
MRGDVSGRRGFAPDLGRASSAVLWGFGRWSCNAACGGPVMAGSVGFRTEIPELQPRYAMLSSN